MSSNESLTDFDGIADGNVGLVRRREAFVNDVPIAETERRFCWDTHRRGFTTKPV